MQGSPQLGSATRGEVELGRQYADDSVGGVIEGERLAKDVFSAAEALLPCGVRKHGGAGCAGGVVAFIEDSPEYWSYTEGMEESACHVSGGKHMFTSGRFAL